jgi:hypothetical protein
MYFNLSIFRWDIGGENSELIHSKHSLNLLLIS